MFWNDPGIGYMVEHSLSANDVRMVDSVVCIPSVSGPAHVAEPLAVWVKPATESFSASGPATKVWSISMSPRRWTRPIFQGRDCIVSRTWKGLLGALFFSRQSYSLNTLEWNRHSSLLNSDSFYLRAETAPHPDGGRLRSHSELTRTWKPWQDLTPYDQGDCVRRVSLNTTQKNIRQSYFLLILGHYPRKFFH